MTSRGSGESFLDSSVAGAIISCDSEHTTGGNLFCFAQESNLCVQHCNKTRWRIHLFRVM